MKIIPKVIYLTHYDKNIIPDKVWKNLNNFASNYEIKYYSNEDCVNFLKENYKDNIVSIFKNLSTGAHKADLFRYCILYKLGGIYLDIKIHIVKNLEEIFDHNTPNSLYTVLSGDHIFQGIIASYPNNKIFLDLINDFYSLHKDFFRVNMNSGHRRYHYFTRIFYRHIRIRIKSNLKVGKNSFLDQNIILFEEKNLQINNEKKDRYGFWNIFTTYVLFCSWLKTIAKL